MTIEEAVIIMDNEMPSCGDKIAFTSEECYEAYQMAIEALRKQMPKQPFERHHAIDGLYEVKWGLCHSCEEVISDDKKYCPNCGQAIDWSDENCIGGGEYNEDGI